MGRARPIHKLPLIGPYEPIQLILGEIDSWQTITFGGKKASFIKFIPVRIRTATAMELVIYRVSAGG
jgi:hypothetical protein